MRKVFQDAVREANEKARLELEASTSDFCTSEQFDVIFAQSLRYINKAYEEEILEETIGQHLKGWWRGRRPFFLLLPFKWADVLPLLGADT